MGDSISFVGLFLALLAPWCLGSIWVRKLLVASGEWNWPLVLGSGYFIGIFTTTLLLRLWDLAGIGLHFYALTGVLLAFCIVGAWAQPWSKSPPQPASSIQYPRWTRILVIILLVLLGWRYLTLLQELAIRPLYPWDAWMNWTPKAIAWYFNGALTTWAGPLEWLQQPDTGEAIYTLGNSRAWNYPPTVPLIQLWTMLGADTHDHSLLQLPWWLLAVNLGLALYGHLRLAGQSVLLSAAACYVLLNLPFYNIHTALAGYADIWLAAFFALALFFLRHWQHSQLPASAGLALLLAFACMQTKNPGLVLGLIILLLCLRTLLAPSARQELIAAVIIFGSFATLLVIGIDITLPVLGRFHIGDATIVAGPLGSHSFEFHDVSGAFLESLFLTINWNLLFPVFMLLLLFNARRDTLLQRPSNELLAIIAVMLFLVFVFFFTDHYWAALNMTTLNRAMLYVIPAFIFYIFLYLVPENCGQRGNEHA